MATCPKCGAKISPFNWKAECKHCGVDILTYTTETNLDSDEARAEEEFQRLYKFLEKLGPLGRRFIPKDEENKETEE